MSYPEIIKEAALEKMFHTDLSLRQISDELDIPRATLHCWKKQYALTINDSDVIDTPAESWTPEEKFAVVLESATMNEVELNPVRAAKVSEAGGNMWSSFRQRMGIDAENWIDYDACYLGLGETNSERCQQYRQFVYERTPDKEICLIRQALRRGQLTGNNRFIDEVEKIMGRRVEFRAQGRPAKADDSQKINPLFRERAARRLPFYSYTQ